MREWFEIERESGADYYGSRSWETWPGEGCITNHADIAGWVPGGGREFKHEAAAEAVCAILEAQDYRRQCRIRRCFEDGRREPVSA